jgi:predicted Zn finger-like uncharacterized protein
MILSCPKCSTRLQLETTKLPTRPFTIKCPKCQNALSVSPSEVVTDEAAAGAPAAPSRPVAVAPEEKPSLADHRLPKVPTEATVLTGEVEQDPIKAMVSLLASALTQSNKPSGGEQTRRRHVLVCLSLEGEIKKAQSALQGHEYELTLAKSSEQAIELLQLSNQIDIVLLDPTFEEDHQGGTAVLRFISMLNAAHRRRLFVILSSPSYKTLDTQTAFLHGVNLLVNSSDLAMLPMAINRGIREFNLLYRSYNEASNLNPF